MGFRTPLTSATAVDTGQPAGAGASLYQGSDAYGVYGVLEFRDGISGDNPAQVIGRANLVPGGGGGYTGQGGSLVVKGGSYNGVTGPEVDFNVESAPLGGYRPALRLTAGSGGIIVPDTTLSPIVPFTALPLNGTYFSVLDPSENTWHKPFYTKLSSGLVVLGGLINVLSISFGNGTQVAGPLPAGCRPAKAEPFHLLGWNGADWRCDVHADGTLIYNGADPNATSSVGGFLSLHGIAFYAEQ